VANQGDGTVSIRLGAGDGRFKAVLTLGAPTYAAGSGPRAAVGGDFNRDGVLDLAVANQADGTVSVLRGNGNGTFRPALTFAAGRDPRSVAVGDFNGDGKPDLAVVNSAPSTVSVLVGNGDGIFQAPLTSASGGTFPLSVAVADFNGDGKLDLAVANVGSNPFCGSGGIVAVLLGNGDGTFRAPLTTAAGGCPRFVAVGDFNGDRVPDLVWANGGPHDAGAVVVALGNGDGTFRAASTIPERFTTFVVVADFNGDGVPDLAISSLSLCGHPPCPNLLLGNGDGTFRGAGFFGLGYTSIAVGDFDGDGVQDLALTNSSSNSVSVVRGNGNGTFQTPLLFGVDFEPVAVVVGNFNRDDKLDLAVANARSNDVSVLLAGHGPSNEAADRPAATLAGVRSRNPCE